MKVLMVLGRSTGGVGTHVAQLSADLRERGVDVLVVTHPLTAEHFDLGPVRLCWPGSGGPLQTLRDLRHLRLLASSADIVHAHGNQGGLLAALAALSTLSSRSSRSTRQGLRDAGPAPMVGAPNLVAPKLVVSQHNAVLRGSGLKVLKRWSQRWVTRQADLVTGASSDLVNEALAFGAVRAELAEVPSPRVPELLGQGLADAQTRVRIRQILLASLTLDGVESENLAGPLIVTISRVAPQKNLAVLVKAASRLGRPCTWVVVGDGDPELLARLRRQASALSAPVLFVGSRTRVGEWLRAAEVFVLPSQWEARALVVQEAMAAGTPVVASDVGGLRDLVVGTGLLVPAGDPAALAKAIDRILADPVLREGLAAHGREVAAMLPDGSDTVEQWLGWYSETLGMT